MADTVALIPSIATDQSVVVPAGHTASIKPDNNRWLDPNWRDFHKLWSMRAQFVLMGFTAAYMIVPAFMSWLPPRLFAVLVMFIVFVGGIFRLLNQKGVDL